MQISQLKRWDSLDCLKGVACIAVVLIHYNFSGGDIPGSVGMAIKAICRFAVPIFLCISGFFLSSNRELNTTKIVQKIKHILKITFLSECFYLLFTFIWYPLMNNNCWNWMDFFKQQVTGDKVLKLLLTNDPLIYAHLWFLYALIYCYFFVLLFVSKRNYSIIYYLAPILLLGYACQQEFGLLPTSVLLSGMDTRIYLYNCFLFRALPFFLFGMILRDKHSQVSSMKFGKVTLIITLLCGSVLEIIERCYWGDCQFYLGSYLVVFSMLIFALKYPNKKMRLIWHIGRDLSMYIYILHIAVGKCLDLLAKNAHWWGNNLYYLGRPIIILMSTFIIAELLFQITKKHKGNETNIN